MTSVFSFPPKTPQEALARLNSGAFNSTDIRRIVDVWLTARIYCDEFNEIFYDNDLTLTELSKLFEKALIALGARKQTELQAAYTLAHLALSRAVANLVRLDDAVYYVYCQHMRHDKLGMEFGESIEAGDLLAEYLMWEDSLTGPPREQERHYNRMQKAAETWLSEHSSYALKDHSVI